MTDQCTRFTDAFISRFMDQETDPGESLAFERHLETCTRCADRLARYQEICGQFTAAAQSEAAAILRHMPHLSPVREKTGRAARIRSIFRQAPVRLRLASAGLAVISAAALIWVFSLVPLSRPPEPSALVKSIDTHGSAVMIIQGPTTGHTIIWFSET